jgi:hypothetical protein
MENKTMKNELKIAAKILGSKGGLSRSEKKVAAVRENIRIARDARWKNHRGRRG